MNKDDSYTAWYFKAHNVMDQNNTKWSTYFESYCRHETGRKFCNKFLILHINYILQNTALLEKLDAGRKVKTGLTPLQIMCLQYKAVERIVGVYNKLT